MAVNKVEAFGETLIDLTNDTVTPETLAEGATAHNASGEPITGIASFNGNSAPVQEIVYVDGTFDMTTLTYLTDVTYAEIYAAMKAGKYVVAKGNVYYGEMVVNIIFLPLSSWSFDGSVMVFDGIMQINGKYIGLENGLILLAVTAEICGSGDVNTRIKLVTTTEIK